jgi:hypothetical protein
MSEHEQVSAEGFAATISALQSALEQCQKERDTYKLRLREHHKKKAKEGWALRNKKLGDKMKERIEQT